MFWTDEMDGLLRDLAGTVASFGEIADEFYPRLGIDVSRNAVIGRATRLGIKTQQKQGRPATTVKLDQSKRLPGRAPDQRPPVLRGDPVAPQRLKPIIELKPHECRWPIGGWPDTTLVLFCSKPRREDSPYCPGHANLGTQRRG